MAQQLKDSNSYKQKALQRKQQKIEDLWTSIGDNPELHNFIKLRNRLQDAHKQREETTGMLESAKMDYSQLKTDLKEFLRKQNKIKSNVAVNKKTR